MTFNLKLLENLLHQPEGPALDFKRKQYRFNGADEIEKSELLKDILALANSWRLTTAYILIGVEEVKGGRSKVLGVNEHLDDAILHQFVNSKTQRPVQFAHQQFPTAGTVIDVIQIPMQERPIFLTRDFGKLRANEVKVRDGSSTRTATPDEIARMGAEGVSGYTPHFLLEWGSPNNRTILPSSSTLHSLVLDPPLHPNTFAQQRYRFGPDPFANRDYSPKIIICTAERNVFTPLGFRLRNESRTAGRRIRFVGSITKIEGLLIQDHLETLPSLRSDFMLSRRLDFPLLGCGDQSVELTDFDDRWEVEIDFGDVRPRDEVWTEADLFVGSTQPCVLRLQGELRGDNLPEPEKCGLQIRIDVERRPMTKDDVSPFLHLQ